MATKMLVNKNGVFASLFIIFGFLLKAFIFIIRFDRVNFWLIADYKYNEQEKWLYLITFVKNENKNCYF